MSKVVLSLLLDNQVGVLSRVAGLFSRRGYNIDSITAGETENPNRTRMTIVARGEPEVRELERRKARRRTRPAAEKGRRGRCARREARDPAGFETRFGIQL